MSNINENTVTMFPIMNPDQEDTQNSFTMTNGTLKICDIEYSFMPEIPSTEIIVQDIRDVNRHPKNHLYVLKDKSLQACNLSNKTYQIIDVNNDSSISCPHDLSMKKNNLETVLQLNAESEDKPICLKCPNCLFISLEDEKLVQHMQERHTGDDLKENLLEFNCPGCPNKFISPKSYKAHLIFDHEITGKDLELFLNLTKTGNENVLPVNPVDNSILSTTVIISDLNIPENKSKTSTIYKCSEKHCNTRMKKLENIEYHYQCHNKSKFQCLECGEIFLRWNLLRGHLWRKHEIDMELFTCDKCSYKTFSLSSLNNIHKRIHNTQKTFLCDICAKAFKNPKQLSTHKAIHKISHKICNFLCDICNRPFASRRLLRLHTEGVHQQLKRFTCNYCDYKANSKSAVQLHERKHTGLKPYHCTLCSYATSDHNSFRRHKSKHTKDYAYACPYCEYGCIQSSTFKIHLRTKHPMESDVITFSCKFCNFKSLRKNNYLTHMGKHKDTQINQNFFNLPLLINQTNLLTNNFESVQQF